MSLSAFVWVAVAGAAGSVAAAAASLRMASHPRDEAKRPPQNPTKSDIHLGPLTVVQAADPAMATTDQFILLRAVERRLSPPSESETLDFEDLVRRFSDAGSD